MRVKGGVGGGNCRGRLTVGVGGSGTHIHMVPCPTPVCSTSFPCPSSDELAPLTDASIDPREGKPDLKFSWWIGGGRGEKRNQIWKDCSLY